MVDIEYLRDYVIKNNELSAPLPIYWYDKKSNKCVTEENFNTEGQILKFKSGIKKGSFIRLPEISSYDLYIEYIEALNDKRENDYLHSSGKKGRFTVIHKNISTQNDNRYAPDGSDFEYFCYTRIIPIVKNWGKENNIEITVNIKKPDNYILDSPKIIEQLVVPTDRASLGALIADVTLENMYFDRRTYQAIDDEVANKAPYLDCVKMPYIPEETIYKCFLKENNLLKEKEQLEKEADFAVAFRWFIDYNPKYDHMLYDEYFRFEKRYLKPHIINWCNEYGISYTDDLEVF